jgi:hypothetical protein
MVPQIGDPAVLRVVDRLAGSRPAAEDDKDQLAKIFSRRFLRRWLCGRCRGFGSLGVSENRPYSGAGRCLEEVATSGLPGHGRVVRLPSIEPPG